MGGTFMLIQRSWGLWLHGRRRMHAHLLPRVHHMLLLLARVCRRWPSIPWLASILLGWPSYLLLQRWRLLMLMLVVLIRRRIMVMWCRCIAPWRRPLWWVTPGRRPPICMPHRRWWGALLLWGVLRMGGLVLG